MSTSASQVTLLLDAIERGESRAADALFPMVYEESGGSSEARARGALRSSDRWETLTQRS